MIGSATHGTEPGDSSPGSAAFLELARSIGDIGASLAAAFVPFIEQVAAAMETLARDIAAAFGVTVNWARILWDEGSCFDYAVRAMGVAESDVRAVLLAGHRRCPAPHVWLWNHRRIPFPVGSPPALVWGSARG